MKKMLKKGSMTVETACLMSLLLLVIMGCLYLFFFVHNRAWLTAAAFEAAVDGSIEGEKDGNSLKVAREKCEELGNTGFFATEKLSGQVNGGKKIQVVYDLDMIKGFGGFSWHLRAEGKALVFEPVSWIRKAKAAAEVVKGVAEGK